MIFSHSADFNETLRALFIIDLLFALIFVLSFSRFQCELVSVTLRSVLVTIRIVLVLL